ncbi:hypothetical protein R1flu_006415 [Riccia fluitans]|uniref:Carbonic anhydrase n=1 Tax=Riccia fluitans TaxID=41844 RepID=A0ABD1YVY5_9MARC
MSRVPYDILHLEAQIKDYIERHPEKRVTATAKLAELAEEMDSEKDTSTSTTSTVFDKLMNGFQMFKKDTYFAKPELTERLRNGQWPKFMIVACADSRVCPSSILSLEPGDAFVIRNVANLVPPYEEGGCPSFASALEYAVLHLKVSYIFVIGHRACGGIGALVKMTPDDGKYQTTFIEKWMAIGKPARERSHVKQMRDMEDNVDILCKHCEKESVNNSLGNLITYPFLLEAVVSKKTSLHGGYYDLIAGTFKKWNYDLVQV